MARTKRKYNLLPSKLRRQTRIPKHKGTDEWGRNIKESLKCADIIPALSPLKAGEVSQHTRWNSKAALSCGTRYICNHYSYTPSSDMDFLSEGYI
jgi:hypothetical protein